MRSVAEELAVADRTTAAARRDVDDLRRRGVPTRTETWYDAPRQVTDWVQGGHVVEGHELYGLALPPRVVATLGQIGEPEYLVIGEVAYSDGRRILQFAVNERWATEQRPPCPDCGGLRGNHLPVEYTDPKTGRSRMVACPNAGRRR